MPRVGYAGTIALELHKLRSQNAEARQHARRASILERENRTLRETVEYLSKELARSGGLVRGGTNRRRDHSGDHGADGDGPRDCNDSAG